MKTIQAIFVAATLLFACAATAAVAEPVTTPGDYLLIAEAPFHATVRGAAGPVPVAGTIAMHWHHTRELAANRKIELVSLNVVLSDLPPGWNGKTPAGTPEQKEDVGVILERPRQGAVLLDFDGRTIDGDVRLLAHYRSIDGVEPPRRSLARTDARRRPDGKGDTFVSARQNGTLRLTVKYDSSFAALLAKLDSSNDIRTTKASFDVDGNFFTLKGGRGSASGFQLLSGSMPVTVQAANAGSHQVTRSLCVQPVKVKRASDDHGAAGRALVFGRSRANELWQKANVVFAWQPVKTVNDSTLRVLSDDDDVDRLLAKVQKANCVEVFFIEKFADQEATGGASTFGGMDDAQIIISDQLKDMGIDRSALAHELGHALNLGHPGEPEGTEYDSSEGTLMCFSGLGVDNPQKNSRDNAEHVDSPFLKNALVPKAGVTDCKSGGSGAGNCGGC